MSDVRRSTARLVHRSLAQRSQLFDHSVDPREQHDAGDEHPEVRARLTALAQDYLERPPVPWEAAPDVELSEQELQQLRALGYGVQ